MGGYLDRLIESLSDPKAYPHRPDSVRVIQTHISVVFLAGDLVYKVKKPVSFGFLDFSTRDKRRYFCRREVDLNSRFSEGVYLGVVPIHEGPSGMNFLGKGREVDYAVLMKRLPEDRTLIRMLDRDEVTPEILERTAVRMARLHEQAPVNPHIASFGYPEVIAQNLRENFDQTASFIGRTIERATHEEISALSKEFMESNEKLFRRRVSRGFIRDCHGDLHLDHVIVLNGIILIDCIEFNERFRYGDTASDLGFLLMDFDFQGYPGYSGKVEAEYVRASGDEDIGLLTGFYKSYRAFVRGKVESFTLDEPEVSAKNKEEAGSAARDYFELSLALLAPPPPVLVITTGLTGTGKSHIASLLGKRLGIEPIRSDIVRKRLHRVDPSEHRLDKYASGIYRANATERTYEALLEEARRSLSHGRSAILDASFMRRIDRVRAREFAARFGARFCIIDCTCPDETARRRLSERMGRGDDPSDGRWDIFLEQKERFESLAPDETAFRRQWDSAGDANAFLKGVVRGFIRRNL
jgi:aminoglycoside phosphotransferase family enzyme/predicted kinase